MANPCIVNIKADDIYKIAEEAILKDEELYNEEAQRAIDEISSRISFLAKQKALSCTAPVKSEIFLKVKEAFTNAGFFVKIVTSTFSEAGSKEQTYLAISWDKNKKPTTTRYFPPL